MKRMKRLFSKRWHRLPVAIIAVVLLVCLVAGSAVYAAGYGFFTANITATVEEAIYPSYGAGDDLSPYMIPESGVLPDIAFVDDWPDNGPINFAFTITAGTADASEFVAGDQLVIPIALRNRGDGTLTVGVTSAVSPGLTVEYGFGTNDAGPTYKYAGTWTSTFTAGLPPHGGNFGSALAGATILFVKIAPYGAPGLQTLALTFTRE